MKQILLSRFTLLYISIFTGFCVKLKAQSEIEGKEVPTRFFTIGGNLGFKGYSPIDNIQISGTDRFKRQIPKGLFPTVETVYDSSNSPLKSVNSDFSIGVNVGYLFQGKNRKALTHFQFEFQYNKAYFAFIAPFGWTSNGGNYGGWVMNDQYLKYGLAYERSTKLVYSSWIGEDVNGFLRFGAGKTFHHRNFGMVMREGDLENQLENGLGFIVRTLQVSPQSTLLSVEIGFRTFLREREHNVQAGVVYYHPLSNSYTQEYEFYQDSVNTGINRITYRGSTVMLNFRYTLGIEHKKKPKTEPVDPTIFAGAKFEGRSVEIQESVETSHKSVRIKVWDLGDVDGDSITLAINGSIIVEHFSLQRKKRTFRIPLEPGANLLVMYAENLGTIPPNTAAVIVRYGFRKKRVPLRSDMGMSGALSIERKQ